MTDWPHWKRRIAKEWLIFLCIIALASIAYFINQYINSENKRQYAKHLIQKYNDELNEYNKTIDSVLKDRLSNWNPQKPKLGKDDFIDFPDEQQCPLSPNRLYLAERIKRLFPHFAEWDELEIRACLGHIDVCKFPLKPHDPKLHIYQSINSEELFNFANYLVFVFIPYTFVILTRSVW